jgi:hypothetical protein
MTAIFSHQVENQLKEEFFGRATRGFFVDVGANDPVDGSQTWHLEQLGWDGVLVEPQRDLAEQSRQRRRAKVYAVACSSPANSGKTVTLNLAGIQSSLNPDFFVPDMVPAGLTEVPVMTLDQILVDAKAPAPLDLVSIDSFANITWACRSASCARFCRPSGIAGSSEWRGAHSGGRWARHSQLDHYFGASLLFLLSRIFLGGIDAPDH